MSAQIAGAEAREAQASADRTGALTGMLGGLASTAGSFMDASGSANSFDEQGFETTTGSGFTPPPLNTSQSRDSSTPGFAGLPVYNFNN